MHVMTRNIAACIDLDACTTIFERIVDLAAVKPRARRLGSGGVLSNQRAALTNSRQNCRSRFQVWGCYHTSCDHTYLVVYTLGGVDGWCNLVE